MSKKIGVKRPAFKQLSQNMNSLMAEADQKRKRQKVEKIQNVKKFKLKPDPITLFLQFQSDADNLIKTTGGEEVNTSDQTVHSSPTSEKVSQSNSFNKQSKQARTWVPPLKQKLRSQDLGHFGAPEKIKEKNDNEIDELTCVKNFRQKHKENAITKNNETVSNYMITSSTDSLKGDLNIDNVQQEISLKNFDTVLSNTFLHSTDSNLSNESIFKRKEGIDYVENNENNSDIFQESTKEEDEDIFFISMTSKPAPLNNKIKDEPQTSTHSSQVGSQVDLFEEEYQNCYKPIEIDLTSEDLEICNEGKSPELEFFNVNSNQKELELHKNESLPDYIRTSSEEKDYADEETSEVECPLVEQVNSAEKTIDENNLINFKASSENFSYCHKDYENFQDFEINNYSVQIRQDNEISSQNVRENVGIVKETIKLDMNEAQMLTDDFEENCEVVSQITFQPIKQISSINVNTFEQEDKNNEHISNDEEDIFTQNSVYLTCMNENETKTRTVEGSNDPEVILYDKSEKNKENSNAGNIEINELNDDNYLSKKLLPIKENSVTEICELSMASNGHFNSAGTNLISLSTKEPSEDKERMSPFDYSGFSQNETTKGNSLKNLETSKDNETYDVFDGDIAMSQVIEIENEYANNIQKNIIDKGNIKDKETDTTFVKPSSIILPPHLNWVQKANEERQKLRILIQDVRKMNDIICKVRQELWPNLSNSDTQKRQFFK